MSADLAATVAKVKPGDEVTATFHCYDERKTYAVLGTIWMDPQQCLAVGDNLVRFWDGRPAYKLTDLVINRPAPDPEPEPPVASVVLDSDEEAWQRLYYHDGSTYWCSAASNTRLSWHRLCEMYGPVHVLYTPEATP